MFDAPFEQLVLRLIERSDVAEVRAVVRDPAKAPAALSSDPKCKLMAGDVTDPETLKDIFAGSSVVYNATSGRSYAQCISVDRDAVGVTAKLALEAGVGRYVHVSSQLVDPTPNRWAFVRIMLNNVVTGFKAPWSKALGMMDMKFAGEQALRQSGLAYTIVRPGRLLDGPLDSAPAFIGQTNSHFMSGAGSTRADVAAVCVRAALDPRARNCTFELACGKPSAAPVADLFGELRPEWDVKTFGDRV